jgi:predicted  nucleic acid-binding Zn-ribbon protein
MSPEFIATITCSIAIIAFLFKLNDRITKLEIELKTEIHNLASRIDRLEFRIERLETSVERLEGEFGIVNEKFVVVDNRISEIKVEFKEDFAKQNENTNARLIQVESDNKNFIKEITDKIFEFFQTQKPIL